MTPCCTYGVLQLLHWDQTVLLASYVLVFFLIYAQHHSNIHPFPCFAVHRLGNICSFDPPFRTPMLNRTSADSTNIRSRQV